MGVGKSSGAGVGAGVKREPVVREGLWLRGEEGIGVAGAAVKGAVGGAGVGAALEDDGAAEALDPDGVGGRSCGGS